jgi:hypothetical protein
MSAPLPMIRGRAPEPATGLINWPATRREAGAHGVVVRVRDPAGESGTQSLIALIQVRRR